MGWVVFVLSLSSNLPRYFLQSTLGEEGLGLFSAVAALPGVLVLVINPLTHSVLPRLARLYADRDRTFWGVMIKSSIFVFVGGLLFVWATAIMGNQLLRNLYGEPYSGLGWLLVLLGVAATVQNLSTMFGAGLTAMRRFLVQGFASTIYCALTFVLCFELIPRYGLLGGGISTIASSFFLVILVAMVLSITWWVKNAGKESR